MLFNKFSRVQKKLLPLMDLFVSSNIKKIPTHLTLEEKYTLFQLSKSVPTNSILVEIGSYLGASSCYIMLGAKKKLNSLYCIDTWHNEGMSEGLVDTYQSFLNNVKIFNNNIITMRGKSSEIFQNFNKKIDFIFFDGDHSINGVREDWENWSQKLNKGAIVVFHDSGWAEGVIKIIQENVKFKVENEHYLPNMYWAVFK